LYTERRPPKVTLIRTIYDFGSPIVLELKTLWSKWGSLPSRVWWSFCDFNKLSWTQMCLFRPIGGFRGQKANGWFGATLWFCFSMYWRVLPPLSPPPIPLSNPLKNIFRVLGEHGPTYKGGQGWRWVIEFGWWPRVTLISYCITFASMAISQIHNHPTSTSSCDKECHHIHTNICIFQTSFMHYDMICVIIKFMIKSISHL
jgi:hypothetical protein